MPEKKKRQVTLTPQQLVSAYRGDQQKVENLMRRQQDVQALLNEMTMASDSIKELQKVSKEENVMISLGAGFYADAKVANIKKVKSSLAGSVLVETDSEKALARLEEEIEKARKELSNLAIERQKTLQNMQGIASILEQGRNALQKARQPQETGKVSSVS